MLNVAPSRTELQHFLSVEDVARSVGVSPWTVRRAIARGALRAGRSATRGPYRIRVADVDRWLYVGRLTP